MIGDLLSWAGGVPRTIPRDTVRKTGVTVGGAGSVTCYELYILPIVHTYGMNSSMTFFDAKSDFSIYIQQPNIYG